MVLHLFFPFSSSFLSLSRVSWRNSFFSLSPLISIVVTQTPIILNAKMKGWKMRWTRGRERRRRNWSSSLHPSPTTTTTASSLFFPHFSLLPTSTPIRCYFLSFSPFWLQNSWWYNYYSLHLKCNNRIVVGDESEREVQMREKRNDWKNNIWGRGRETLKGEEEERRSFSMLGVSFIHLFNGYYFTCCESFFSNLFSTYSICFMMRIRATQLHTQGTHTSRLSSMKIKYLSSKIYINCCDFLTKNSPSSPPFFNS